MVRLPRPPETESGGSGSGTGGGAAATSSGKAPTAAMDRRTRLYEAAVLADQNAKLSIFCTRPAIYAPVCAFMRLPIHTPWFILCGSHPAGLLIGLVQHPLLRQQHWPGPLPGRWLSPHWLLT